MNFGLTGASGFIGRAVIDLALRRGHEVIAFSRNRGHAIPGCEMRPFSLESAPDISGCDAIIHLAGEPVAGLWTAAKKRRIRESRVQGTRRVAEAILAAPVKPEAFVCASGIALYGDGGEQEQTEDFPSGDGFLAETAQAWEAEARQAENVTRVVRLRTSLVLGPRGGALAAMLPLFRAGLGARLGSGQQWAAWIHLADMAMLTLFAVENQEAEGAINAAAPWPVRNREFTQALARAVHRPAFLAVPAFALRLALDGFACELLESRRVVPGRATELGFRFRFPELKEALADLLP